MRTLQATAVWGWVYVPGLQAPASTPKVTKSHPVSQSAALAQANDSGGTQCLSH